MSDSFEHWATSRAPSLLRFAYLLTGSQHAAEDAVQSALVSACTHWSRVGCTRDPDTYVRRMVVNAHISAWRRSGRRELAVADPDAGPTRDVADSVARDTDVWRACRSLPPQQRAAVVLRFYEDLDYAEIARVLDVAEATARSHVHRGLAAVRDRLVDETHAEREG